MFYNDTDVKMKFYYGTDELTVSGTASVSPDYNHNANAAMQKCHYSYQSLDIRYVK